MHRKVVKGKLKWGVSKPNEKIKNATKVEVDGIKFRSKLEAFAYSEFKKAGIELEYEKTTFVLIDKFELNGEKVREMTWTPDFVNDDMVLEIKGFSNDGFSNKLKTFKHYLMSRGLTSKIYIIKNKTEVRKFIEDYTSGIPYNYQWGMYSVAPRKWKDKKEEINV